MKPIQVTALGVQVGRLRNVIKALSYAPPEQFTMKQYAYGESSGYGCGSPACALGWYASHPELQDEFCLRPHDSSRHSPIVLYHKPSDMDVWGPDETPQVSEHFGILSEQAAELFANTGCCYAKIPKQAQDYIRRFIKDEVRFGVNVVRYNWSADEQYQKRLRQCLERHKWARSNWQPVAAPLL